jgi:ribosomal protein S8|tara:strand:+ start:785 stop:2869 length:2085 start_codon:yes stop_codon:yes gene_type:complete
MQSDSISEALTYKEKEPDIKTLRYAYDQTVVELEAYFDLCRTSYDDRRNWWPGKSRDHRKHGADAFPWEGAADMEAHTIDERITRLVALFMSSLNRANIRAFPVESSDIARSKLVSGFLKWMVSSGYIPRFKKEMELGANYLLERGLLITYVGWQREDRSYLQLLDINQIAAINPEVSTFILEGDKDDIVIDLLMDAFPTLSKRRAKKAIKDLRNIGQAELPVVRRQVNAPEVKTLAPDGDFFFPPYVTDPQRAPYCFWKTYYTAQELLNKVTTDGWDADFVEHVIDKYRGVNIDSIEREQEGRRSLTITDNAYEAEELIEIVYGYQRLIDREDGSEGIYCTVFHKDFSGDETTPGFAKFELLNGYEDYPVVVSKISEDSKRLYDVQTIPDVLRGIQNQVKVERDSRIDRNSLATLPPILHPVGQAPTDWGPGRMIPYRRKGDLDFAPTPPPPTGSIEIERTMEEQADRLCGLDETSQISQIRKQFLVDKFLHHAAEVLQMCYRCYQRFGPDSTFFRVTGSPDPQMFDKGDPDENFDIIIDFDVLNNDPETQEKKLQAMVSLTQLDRNGRIDINSLLDSAAFAVDPVLADSVLQPVEAAQEQVVRQVTDDLAKIFAGIEMPARPNGAQIALQVIQQYTSQPDIAQRLQSDEAFAARMEKYAAQYTFQIQQMQNAQIGRVGTEPAQMGDIQTQGM